MITPSDDSGFAPEPDSIAETPQGEDETPNVGTAEEETKEKRKGQRTFGSLSPQEAGRRSAQARRAKSLAQAEQIKAASDGRVVLIRVPVALGDIISRLAADAQKGNTQAARELREWMREYPAEDQTDLSALDERTRQALVARLLAEIVEEEGALPQSIEA